MKVIMKNKSGTQASPPAPEVKTDQFTITLENINSAFGISVDTLRAIAASHGVTEEQIIVRALTQWAKTEIPDLDLDAPTLTAAQLKTLLDRRTILDATKNQSTSSLHEMFKSITGEQENHENAKPSPSNGEHR